MGYLGWGVMFFAGSRVLFLICVYLFVDVNGFLILF